MLARQKQTRQTWHVLGQTSITISWPAPDGGEFVENSTVSYTATDLAAQSSGRKKRQANTFSGTIPVSGSQTSTQVTGANFEPYHEYEFRVRANFGNGLEAEIVGPFRVTSSENRELLDSLYVGRVLSIYFAVYSHWRSSWQQKLFFVVVFSLLAYPLLLFLPIINLHIRMCSN